MIPKKRCAYCGKIKPASEFHRNSKHKDGLSAYCRDCVKLYRYKSAPSIMEEFKFKNVEVRRPSIDYPYHCPVCGMGADTKEEAMRCCEQLRVQKWG